MCFFLKVEVQSSDLVFKVLYFAYAYVDILLNVQTQHQSFDWHDSMLIYITLLHSQYYAVGSFNLEKIFCHSILYFNINLLQKVRLALSVTTLKKKSNATKARTISIYFFYFICFYIGPPATLQ